MVDIFVFGSNLAGRHGKGAALYAKNNHGAIYGQGEGLQGSSYAIPTKDQHLNPLPLYQIGNHIHQFLRFARENPQLIFNVTAIGTGLAGYHPKQISPYFVNSPVNVNLPDSFKIDI